MHKSLIALAGLAVPLLLAAPVSADCNDPFAKPTEVLDFHIKMERADWVALKASKVRNVDGATDVNFPACMDKFPKFKAEFRCGTVEPWIKIGVRKKKGTERGEESPEKPPLKLDMNEDFMAMVPTAKGQRWPAALMDKGYRKLTLNNGHGNKAAAVDTDIKEPFMLPLLQSEHVALRLLSNELPTAPRTAYAKVTLHFPDKPDGEYHGVYILVEDIDHTAIETRFGIGNAKGRLIKASTPDCYPEVQYEDMDANNASNNASIKAFEEWVSKDPAQCGANWLEETKKGLDLDSLLRQEAIREILLSGNDTITNSRAYLVWNQYGDGNNWYAFDPKVGVRQYIPWDVDLTFGNQRGACTTLTPSTPVPPPTPGVDGGAPTPVPFQNDNRWKCPYDIPLLAWCNDPTMIRSTDPTKSRIGRATTCNPVIQRRYLQVMCQLTNGPMSSSEILKLWEETNTTLRPIIPLEKEFIWGGKDPLDPKITKSYAAEYERLKAWIPQRIKSVQEQITAKGIDCKPGCPVGAIEPCSYNGGPGARRCMANAWTACQKATAPVAPNPDAGASAPTCGGDAGVLRGDTNGPPGMPYVPPDAGADAASGAGGSSGGTLGSGGSSGGSGGSSPTRRTGGRSGTSQPINDPPPSKSGCSIGGEGSADAASLFSILALAGLMARRRRRE